MWERMKKERQKVPATKLVAFSTEVVKGRAKAPNKLKRGHRTWVDAIQSRKLILSGTVRGKRRTTPQLRQRFLTPTPDLALGVRRGSTPDALGTGGLDMPCDFTSGISRYDIAKKVENKTGYRTTECWNGPLP
jgi:hypothetical protein